MDDQGPEILRPEPTLPGALDKIGRSITLFADGLGDLVAVVGPVISQVRAALTRRQAATVLPADKI
jgi:hypothetical protein